MEHQIVKVKTSEIESLISMGFKDEGGELVFDSENGAVSIDKQSGVVAIICDGVSIEEVAIVNALIESGIAEVVDGNELDASVDVDSEE